MNYLRVLVASVRSMWLLPYYLKQFFVHCVEEEIQLCITAFDLAIANIAIAAL